MALSGGRESEQNDNNYLHGSIGKVYAGYYIVQRKIEVNAYICQGRRHPEEPAGIDASPAAIKQRKCDTHREQTNHLYQPVIGFRTRYRHKTPDVQKRPQTCQKIINRLRSKYQRVFHKQCFYPGR